MHPTVSCAEHIYAVLVRWQEREAKPSFKVREVLHDKLVRFESLDGQNNVVKTFEFVVDARIIEALRSEVCAPYPESFPLCSR